MILNLNAGKAAATYTWSVQAYDPENRLICSSNILTFEILPVSAPTLTEIPLASPVVDQTQSPVP